jgi:hypothetical protein
MKDKKESSVLNMQSLENLEIKLEEIFTKKVPALPENIKEIIVKYSPYVVLVILIFTLPLILSLLGIGAILLPASFLGGIGSGISSFVTLIFSIATLIVEILALPGLFKRAKRSWKLMFYNSLIMLVQYIFTMNIGGLVIGSAISWYFLFQIKSYYKN